MFEKRTRSTPFPSPCSWKESYRSQSSVSAAWSRPVTGNKSNAQVAFSSLEDDGEMRELIGEFDWTSTHVRAAKKLGRGAVKHVSARRSDRGLFPAASKGNSNGRSTSELDGRRSSERLKRTTQKLRSA